MNLGGVIDQHINAMGIDDDPVSTIDLSALNQLFNNVLAPTFSPQPLTSTQQLPPMLLQQQRPMLLPPPQQHLDHVAGTDGGLATGGRSNIDQRHVAVLLSLVGPQRVRGRDKKELGSAGIVATAANRYTFRQQDDDHSSSARCQGEDDVVVGQGSASVSNGGAGGRRGRGAAGRRRRAGGGRERGRRGRRLRSQPLGHSALGQDFHARRPGENITRYFDTIPYAIFEICTFKVFSEEALVFLKKHNATKLANVYVQALVNIRDKRKKNSPANVLALANIRRKLWGTLRAKMRPSLGRYIRTLEAANFFMAHSAKVLCAMCQKKHVGCIHHPLEKRWPNCVGCIKTTNLPCTIISLDGRKYTKKIFVKKFEGPTGGDESQRSAAAAVNHVVVCVRVCL